MDATLIVIDNAAELARAHALVDRLMDSDEPHDIARLQAQARLIAAYEETKWPRRAPGTAEIVRYALPAPELFEAAPRVKAWLAACQARPAFKKMWEARDKEPA